MTMGAKPFPAARSKLRLGANSNVMVHVLSCLELERNHSPHPEQRRSRVSKDVRQSVQP